MRKHNKYIKAAVETVGGYVTGDVGSLGYFASEKFNNYMAPYKRKLTVKRLKAKQPAIRAFKKQKRAQSAAGNGNVFVGKKTLVSYKGVKGRSKMKNEKIIDISQHNDLSFHTAPSIFMGPKVSKMKTISRFTYEHNQEYISNANQGFQSVSICSEMFNRSQILGVTSTTRNGPGRLADDLFLMNPYSNLPGNAYLTQTGSASQDRIFVKNVTCLVELLSMNIVPQYCDLYICTPKYDVLNAPDVSWSSGLADLALGQGVNLPATTLAATTGATSGSLATINYGTSPSVSRTFRQQWNVKHCKSIILQPGDQYNLRYNFVYNKPLQKSMFSASTRSENYLKGWTVAFMLVGKGGLVGIVPANGTLATGAAEISHSTVKIGAAFTYHYNLRAMPVSRIESQRAYEGMLAGDTTERQQRINDVDQNALLAVS